MAALTSAHCDRPVGMYHLQGKHLAVKFWRGFLLLGFLVGWLGWAFHCFSFLQVNSV